jgi:hypothetical protein
MAYQYLCSHLHAPFQLQRLEHSPLHQFLQRLHCNRLVAVVCLVQAVVDPLSNVPRGMCLDGRLEDVVGGEVSRLVLTRAVRRDVQNEYKTSALFVRRS